MHDQFFARERGVQVLEFGEGANGGQTHEHLVADRDAVTRRTPEGVEFGEDGAVGFNSHEAVRRDLGRDRHVLAHSAPTVGQGDDHLLRWSVQDGSLSVTTGDRTTRTASLECRRLDTAVGEYPTH